MCSDILSLNSQELVSQAASAPTGPAWPPNATGADLLIGSDSGMAKPRDGSVKDMRRLN